MNYRTLLPGYTKGLIYNELFKGGCFDELKFPLSALSKYSVIQFRSSVATETAGLGASLNLAHAYKVAYFEYLERKALFDFGVQLGFDSTNGIALHKFEFLARISARSELFERDSFLLHWYTCTPFESIEKSKISNSLASAIAELNTLGFETRLCRTLLGEQTTVITTLINTTTGGFVIGLSSGRGHSGNIEKSFLEACINLFFGDCGRSKEELTESIKQKGVFSLSGHRAYWLYISSIPDWFYGPVESHIRYEKNTYDINYFLLTQSPFPVVATRSPEILNLEVGELSQASIRLLRRRVKNGNSPTTSIWNWPHPIP